MPAKFVIFMVLVTSGSANPHHGPNIQVNIQQKVNIGFVSLCTVMGGSCQAPDDSCSRMSINNKTLGTKKYCKPFEDRYACCAPSGQEFMADIENSISFALRNTILFESDNGTRTLRTFNSTSNYALIQFFRIMLKYIKIDQHIFQEHTYRFIENLYAILEVEPVVEFSAGELLDMLNDIQTVWSDNAFISAKWEPSVSCHNIYSESQVGRCYPKYWVYTCGLWNIFHTLTVSAANAKAEDPLEVLEVLEAIKGFVINFLGCDDCQKHLDLMYNQTLGINSSRVDTSDKAILWLWCAHNAVNQRFTGLGLNHTDPKYYWPPHPLFPISSACEDCWDVNSIDNCATLFCFGKTDAGHCFRTPDDPVIDYNHFNSSAVLSYLKRVYRGSYSKLKTNNVWRRLNLDPHSLCPGQ